MTLCALMISGTLLSVTAALCQTTDTSVGTADGTPLKLPAPSRAGAIGAFWAKQGRAPSDDELQAAQA